MQQFQFVNSGESTQNTNFQLAHASYEKDNAVCSISKDLIDTYLTESRTRRKINRYFEFNNQVPVNKLAIQTEEIMNPNIAFDLSEYKLSLIHI